MLLTSHWRPVAQSSSDQTALNKPILKLQEKTVFSNKRIQWDEMPIQSYSWCGVIQMSGGLKTVTLTAKISSVAWWRGATFMSALMSMVR